MKLPTGMTLIPTILMKMRIGSSTGTLEFGFERKTLKRNRSDRNNNA
jgi:hypothetical protein